MAVWSLIITATLSPTKSWTSWEGITDTDSQLVKIMHVQISPPNISVQMEFFDKYICNQVSSACIIQGVSLVLCPPCLRDLLPCVRRRANLRWGTEFTKQQNSHTIQSFQLNNKITLYGKYLISTVVFAEAMPFSTTEILGCIPQY